jgi:hydrogenase large subunit
MNKITCNIPLNRVEGDLTLQVDFEGGKVSSARSVGTLYRGFEKMMKGRGVLDGLVITPRICGICSLSHLTAAALALDSLSVSVPAVNAVRVRNIAGIMEAVQSDIRQTILMFMPDFTNPAYSSNPLYDEAVRRYAPLKGESCVSAVRHSTTLVEVMAILGGQWPHTSFMVPGGITNVPTVHDIVQCCHLLKGSMKWYEDRILGCSMERFAEVDSVQALDSWLEESDSHKNSELGFLIRFGRSIGLHETGRSYDSFISYGAFDIPKGSQVTPLSGKKRLINGGFAKGTKVAKLDQELIKEYIECSWYEGYTGGLHPYEGLTEPVASGHEGKKYSWVKAPRYDGSPAETGPLAQMVINGVPLFTDLVRKDGASTLTRQLARIARPALLFKKAVGWLDEMASTLNEVSFYTSYKNIKDGRGLGLSDAARGALGHWVCTEDGYISKYQVITPTAWNGSPRDDAGRPGAWEKALEGIAVKDPENPVEIGHIVRSFDPCLVCAVHWVDGDRQIFRC